MELQVDTEDLEQVISFLCSKFSGMIDKVQAAETRQARLHEIVELVESRTKEATKRRHLAAIDSHMSVRAGSEEVDHMRWCVKERRSAAQGVVAELLHVRQSTAALEEQCHALRARCQMEHQGTIEAVDVAAHGDEARAALEQERERLKAEATRLGGGVRAAEKELHRSCERQRHRDFDVRSLQERLIEASRSRQAAERRAAAQHEELCGTVQQSSLFRERLEAARRELVRRQEELCQEDVQLAALRVENQRREQESAGVEENLSKLRKVGDALEGTISDHASAQAKLRTAQQVLQTHVDIGTGMARKQEEVEKIRASATGRIKVARADIVQHRQKLELICEVLRGVRCQQEVLEEKAEELRDTGIHNELQYAFAEAAQVRNAKVEIVASCSELRHRLHVLEPTLEVARCRCAELQGHLEDAEREVGRARHGKESLMCEVNRGREKMRTLRRRHVQLLEQVQTLEKRLLRSSGAFGGTAGFAACACPVATAASGSSVAAGWPIAHAADDPGSLLTSFVHQEPIPVDFPEVKSPAVNTLAAPDCLDALKQWIELQEAQSLGNGSGIRPRTPPCPCHVPANPEPHLPLSPDMGAKDSGQLFTTRGLDGSCCQISLCLAGEGQTISGGDMGQIALPNHLSAAVTANRSTPAPVPSEATVSSPPPRRSLPATQSPAATSMSTLGATHFASPAFEAAPSRLAPTALLQRPMCPATNTTLAAKLR